MQAARACAIRLDAGGFCVQRVNADALGGPFSAMAAVEHKRGAMHKAARAAQVRSLMYVALSDALEIGPMNDTTE
jgi:hypothetical protein